MAMIEVTSTEQTAAAFLFLAMHLRADVTLLVFTNTNSVFADDSHVGRVTFLQSKV